MNKDTLLHKALKGEFLSPEEGVFLFENVPTAELMEVGNMIRFKLNPEKKVTWIIDRNSNTTNVCVANCKFCNFYRRPGHEESYITSLEEYAVKIEETFRLGGEQLLLQGGHHPDLGLSYYVNLFRELKKRYPLLKLHALGPPEIAHITKLEGSTHIEVLKALKEAGLDSLPGAGAEILDDRVRRLISKGKCGADEWLDVMRAAHKIDLTTSATLMFGHIETNLERIIVKLWGKFNAGVKFWRKFNAGARLMSRGNPVAHVHIQSRKRQTSANFSFYDFIESDQAVFSIF